MLSALLSRLILLVFGTLYPAYASHKAVKTKNVKEYVKWMMYWIVFALYTFVEIFTDIFVAFWMPFYYELKIAFVLWLTCPATKGSSYIYRKIVHPFLHNHEEQLDAHLDKLWDDGYQFFCQLGSQGASYLVEVLLELFKKGQTTVSAKLPTILELAQEVTQTHDSAASDVVDATAEEFEDYDVVDSQEINAGNFPYDDRENVMNMPDVSGKPFIEDMDVGFEDGVSVESRPLRLRSAHQSPKKQSVPEESVAVTKGGKVRQRRTTRK